MRKILLFFIVSLSLSAWASDDLERQISDKYKTFQATFEPDSGSNLCSAVRFVKKLIAELEGISDTKERLNQQRMIAAVLLEGKGVGGISDRPATGEEEAEIKRAILMNTLAQDRQWNEQSDKAKFLSDVGISGHGSLNAHQQKVTGLFGQAYDLGALQRKPFTFKDFIETPQNFKGWQAAKEAMDQELLGILKEFHDLGNRGAVKDKPRDAPLWQNIFSRLPRKIRPMFFLSPEKLNLFLLKMEGLTKEQRSTVLSVADLLNSYVKFEFLVTHADLFGIMEGEEMYAFIETLRAAPEENIKFLESHVKSFVSMDEKSRETFLIIIGYASAKKIELLLSYPNLLAGLKAEYHLEFVKLISKMAEEESEFLSSPLILFDGMSQKHINNIRGVLYEHSNEKRMFLSAYVKIFEGMNPQEIEAAFNRFSLLLYLEILESNLSGFQKLTPTSKLKFMEAISQYTFRGIKDPPRIKDFLN